MRRLRFRLERVLALRRLTEQSALGEYALERRRAEDAEAAARAARDSARQALQQLAEHSCAPMARIVGERVVRSLDGRAHNDGRRAVDVRARAEQAATRWRARRVEAEAIARLKERATERHRTESEAAEERERDERTAARRAFGIGAAERLKPSGDGLR